MRALRFLTLAAATALVTTGLQAQVCNVKVVTDASPDYTDMDSLVHSITGNWKTDADKMWALFYWNHQARCQTIPMMLHGVAHTDPIRQFNDYGYTMCSTISGIECSIWNYMGYKVRYYDISLHTVAEVFYDNGWHLYDGSLSNYYTLCDGKTIAGVQDIGKTLGCEASGGKQEPGHIAIYHSVHGTSPDGFLEGSDNPRDLRHLGEVTFKPEYLKFREYLTDAQRGHRYILNLRDGEVYTRNYNRLDGNGGKDKASDPAYFVPSGKTKEGKPYDPESYPSGSYHYDIRGNGVRTFEPKLVDAQLAGSVYSSKNVKALNPGLQPSSSGAAEAVFKIEGANVITSTKILADVVKASADDQLSISISTDDGMNWKDIYKAEAQGPSQANLNLLDEVNGAYEVLVKVTMQAKSQPSDVQLKSIKFETTTQLNRRTQPKLNLGKNTVYVGAGDQTESIVLWPELVSDKYKAMAYEVNNLKSRTPEELEGYLPALRPEQKGEGYVIFKIDAPQDITRITQSGKVNVKASKASVAFEHSFDGGKTWARSNLFNDNAPPYDDEVSKTTTEIPAGVRSVLFKYVLNNAGLFAVRMEADHKIADTAKKPLEVTFNWSERQADYSLVKRSHTQLVDKLPATYTIDVGGADHPVVESMVINAKGARGDLKYGYSDGKDAGGEKWVGQWVTYGRNLALGKPYTLSVPPSENKWGAGDPDGKKLTDGRVGSNFTGGTTYKEGALWKENLKPEITVDLGQPQTAAAFRIQLFGYPWNDAMRGTVKDKVEVFVSDDGKEFKSAGKFNFALRWRDIPVNCMYPDDESFAGPNYTLVLDKPIQARYVKFACVSSRMMDISEVQVLDSVKSVPFDLNIALPKM